MNTDRTITRSLVRVLIVTGVVLSIPLVANQFTEGEGWSLFDFVLVGGLIMGSGLLFELGAKTAAGRTSAGSRVAAGITAVVATIGGAAAVLGEFGDAPGLVLLGGLLVIGAVVLGLWTVHSGTEAKPPFSRLLVALAIPGLAGLGGAAVVFSEVDDAPGGILIGMLMIVGAMVLGMRLGGRGGESQPSSIG